MRSPPPPRADLDAWHRRHAAGRGPLDDLPFYAELLNGPARVLELGAGCGRIACALASVGHQVVALDIHPDALPPAKADVLRLVADMSEFALRTRFELIVIADNTLQLLDGAGRADCLDAAARHLAPGGRLAFEVSDFQADTAVDERDDVPVAEADGITLVAGLRQDRLGRTTHYRRHFQGDGWTYADELTIRSLDREEAVALVTAAGLRVETATVAGYRTRVVAIR